MDVALELPNAKTRVRGFGLDPITFALLCVPGLALANMLSVETLLSVFGRFPWIKVLDDTIIKARTK